jgi:hypothetical protein
MVPAAAPGETVAIVVSRGAGALDRGGDGRVDRATGSLQNPAGLNRVRRWIAAWY